MAAPMVCHLPLMSLGNDTDTWYNNHDDNDDDDTTSTAANDIRFN